MQRRHQRRALAAGGHVAAAQVADHVDATQLGQQRAIHQLQRVAGAVEFLRAVAHRLPMGADCMDLRHAHAALPQQGVDYAGVNAHQRVGGQRSQVQFVVAAAVQA